MGGPNQSPASTEPLIRVNVSLSDGRRAEHVVAWAGSVDRALELAWLHVNPPRGLTATWEIYAYEVVATAGVTAGDGPGVETVEPWVEGADG